MVEQVGYRGHVLGDADEAVVVEPPVVAGDGGEVVGLARVGVGVVPSLEDALLADRVEARVGGDFGKVLYEVAEA